MAQLISVDRRQLLAALWLAASNCRAGATPPPRVASMDYALTETMLSLGIAPIAMPAADDWARWVVEPALPQAVVNLGIDREVNLELLQSLKPERIVSTPYLSELTPMLERIAPVTTLAIYQEGGAGPLARAVTVTHQLAALLERTAAGEDLIAAADARFEADRRRLVESAQMPVLIVNFMDARHVRVYGAKSLFQDVLHRIGLRNAWARPTNYWGFATVGIEALADCDAAALIYLDPVPPDALSALDGSSLWRALPFVRSGRIRRLPPVLMFGALPSAQRFSRLLADVLLGVAPHG